MANQITKILGSNPVQFQSQLPEHSQDSQFCSDRFPTHLKANLSHIEELPASAESLPEDIVNYFLYILENLSGQVRTIFETQMIWSLRVSEVLSIRNKDIFNTGLIWIQSKKGSNSRFISSRSILLMKNHKKAYSDLNVFILSYSAYYNALRKVGFKFRSSNARINDSVTHAFRKFNLNYISIATGVPMDILQNYSGHKSFSGLSYYLGKNAIPFKGGL
jgi:integrase